MTVPFPGIDAISLDFTLHLLEQGIEVRRVRVLVPVVVRRAVPLAESPLTAGKIINLLLARGHQPTR